MRAWIVGGLVLGLWACGDVSSGDGSGDVGAPDVVAGDVGVADAGEPGCQDDEDCVGYFGDVSACQVTLCDKATGACVVGANKDYTPCDDGDACTLEDSCLAGACVPGRDRVCEDGNGCTDNGCDGVDGCLFVANQAECDDGNACTEGDVCQDGACAGEGTDACGCAGDEDCVALDDDNLCNGVLVCGDGTCQLDSDSVVVCDASQDTVCMRATCNPSLGVCEMAGLSDVACTDGNPCTTNDICEAGQCVGAGSECPCEGDEECVGFGDDDLCNGEITCVDGACSTDPETIVTCEDTGDACTVGACAAETGQCEPKAAADGTLCEDGDACTGGDSCSAGACAGTLLDCEDASACTDDGCDSATGCTHDDVDCSDGDLCTDDGCEDTVGCVWAPADCDDDSACTVDGCQAENGCTHEKVVCDDGDACTLDVCNPDSGCSYSTIEGCEPVDPCASLAAEFDGQSCIEVPGFFGAAPSAYTIEFWIRPDNQEQKGFVLDKIQDKDWKVPGFRLRYLDWNTVNGVIPVLHYEEVKTDGNYHGLLTVQPYPPQGWKHYAITRGETGLMRTFIDGVAQGLNQFNAEKFMVDQTNDHPLYIGCQDADDGFLEGRIDELRISDGVRFTSSFDPPTAPLNTDADTLLLYHFEEGQDVDTVLDSSGHDLHGTWTGVPNYSQDSPVLIEDCGDSGT